MLVKLENRDGRRDIAFHLTEDAAISRDPLAGKIPNGTSVELLLRSKSPKGHAKVRYGDADVYVRQLHMTEAPNVGYPENGDIAAHLSMVMLEQCNGRPSVAFHVNKDSAERREKYQGTIPNGTRVQLLEPGKHNNDFALVRYSLSVSTDVYVRQANIKGTAQQNPSPTPWPTKSRSQLMVLRHCNGRPDIVFHRTLEAAQQKEIPHGKAPDGSRVEMLIPVEGGNGWAQVRWCNLDIWINSAHLAKDVL